MAGNRWWRMKDTGADDTVIERLEWALEANTLPRAACDYARHLLNRLSQPVRVSLLGAPGSGKSQLVNMFLGQPLVPQGAELPTTEYVWGERPQTVVTAADGSVAKVHNTDLNALSGRNVAFLRVALPVPILKRINLLEMVTDGSPEELTSGVDWVVRRTDIALWCTQTFGEGEQAIWSRVPDSLKDHAFLVLTKADILSAKQQLSSRVSALETVVAEEFHSLFAVATLQALRAFQNDTVDEALFHASGGGALSSEILRHAERGRRADFDSAHMFLARYQVEAVPPSASRAKAAAPSVPVADIPERSDDNPATAENAPQHETVAAEAAPKIDNVALFSEAVGFLRRRGESLSETAAALGEGHAAGVVEHCVSAVEHLMDMFSNDDSGCKAADAFIDDLAEAQDMMVLMQIEDGDGPAADAVTLLLQLRRDMEMQLAA